MQISMISLIFYTFLAYGSCASLNDACSQAVRLPSISGLSAVQPSVLFAKTTGDPSYASSPACSGSVGTRSVWYTMLPSISGTYVVSTCAKGTTLEGTMLAVYTSSDNTCTGNFTLTSPDSCAVRGCSSALSSLSSVSVDLEADKMYYVVVWSLGSLAPKTSRTALQVSVHLKASSICSSFQVPPVRERCRDLVPSEELFLRSAGYTGTLCGNGIICRLSEDSLCHAFAINGNLEIAGSPLITTQSQIGFEYLAAICGNVEFSSNPSITSVFLPNLGIIGGSLTMFNNPILNDANFPSLTLVSHYSISGNVALKFLYFDQLCSVNSQKTRSICGGNAPAGSSAKVTLFSCTSDISYVFSAPAHDVTPAVPPLGCPVCLNDPFPDLSTPAPANTSVSSGSASIGLVIGIVIGVIVLALIAALVLLLIVRRKRQQQRFIASTAPKSSDMNRQIHGAGASEDPMSLEFSSPKKRAYSPGIDSFESY